MSRPPAKSDPQRPDPDLLLWTYRHGIFPMADPITGDIEWFSPDPRAIIPLDAFHVPTNVARVRRQGVFEIRIDTAFERVMRACAQPRADDDLTWIDDRLVAAYVGLHERGHAHSVEAWRDGDLVGGLYGVHIGGAFFGESMFVRPDLGGTNASKVCLVELVDRLRRWGFTLLDTQFTNPHLLQFGCEEIPRNDYLARLIAATERDVVWGDADRGEAG